MSADPQVPPRDGEGDRAKRGGGGSRFTQRPEVYAARKQRKEQTLPEGMLWKRLRANRLGVKFRRQHPIGPYVVDFYCASARLVIEVDGSAHDNAVRLTRDRIRDSSLGELGYDVLRLAAADLLRDVDSAIAAIVARVESPLRQPLRGCHLPASGEALS